MNKTINGNLHLIKSNLSRAIIGPALVLACVVVIDIFLRAWSFKIPNPPAILILIVVFSAFYSGLRSGLVSAVMAWFYFAYFFSTPGAIFHYSNENLWRVVLWGITTPTMVFMIGFLRRRAEHSSALAELNSVLKTQMADSRRAEERIQLLQTITLAISETEDLASAMGVVLRKVCESTGWIFGQAWLPSDNGRLECMPVWYTAATGLDHFRRVSMEMTFSIGIGLPGKVWSSKKPVWMANVADEGNFPRSAVAKKAGLHTGLGIPVMAEDKVVAVIEFFMREPRQEDERLISVVSGVAMQLGALILRKRAETAMRASENQLRAIVNAEPECVKVVSMDGVLLQMNPAGLAMIEASNAEQVIGKPIWQLLLPEYREPFRSFIGEVLRNQKGKLEFEIIGLKGAHRWMETHAVPLFLESEQSPCILSVTRDITERKISERRLNFLAHYDSLTSLPNRVQLIESIEQAKAEADRRERLVGVVFLDLDRFKYVNDSLGHEEGDAMLKEVAVRLSGAVRRGDTVARLSGDEFALVLADMGHVDDATHVAQKILDIFKQSFHIAGRELFITASMGITLYPFDDRDAQGLLRNADAAMYRAKESGKNSYQFYAAEMTAKASERLALENDLRFALDRRELFLNYQPIADCRTGRVIGMEALLRWQHPERGLISPVQFIPLAEETGVIVPIGEWVLQTACEQCQAWHSSGYPPLYIAVNLSARQFHQKNLAASIYKVLQTTGLNPIYLNLELTEGLVMQQADASSATLRELKAMNVTISIDDFGTGYSSLSYLKRFPIDILKIDQSFVRDIPGDADDAAIAGTIITMAHSLGLKVVAEGVETVEQLHFMRTHDCDGMQGYYLSKPMSSEQCEQFFKDDKRLASSG
ncbi:MAG: EAL domain-containing protein [Gammaproteobacteria bacterium]|nr:EAL domain-containing protein [Gammaproteobacteria bacterium]